MARAGAVLDTCAPQFLPSRRAIQRQRWAALIAARTSGASTGVGAGGYTRSASRRDKNEVAPSHRDRR